MAFLRSRLTQDGANYGVSSTDARLFSSASPVHSRPSDGSNEGLRGATDAPCSPAPPSPFEKNFWEKGAVTNRWWPATLWFFPKRLCSKPWESDPLFAYFLLRHREKVHCPRMPHLPGPTPKCSGHHTTWHAGPFITASFCSAGACSRHLSAKFRDSTSARSTLCWWISFRWMIAATNFTTAVGWWPVRPTLRCRNVCTSTPTRRRLENSGCRRWSLFTSWNWPTTSPTSTATWVWEHRSLPFRNALKTSVMIPRWKANGVSILTSYRMNMWKLTDLSTAYWNANRWIKGVIIYDIMIDNHER